MKVNVIVITRGRAQRAGGVIECARNLLSGQHDVEFIVAMDGDDTRSIEWFAHFAGVTTFVRPRPIGPGDVWNRAARDAHPADFYLCLPDDAWICTPWWDALMVNGLTGGVDGDMASVRLGILAWHDAAQPTIASIFGMAAKWIDINGFVFDPRFPFWFGDSALVEVAVFATGLGMPGTSSLQFASLPGNVNPRLRDMDLWWAFFAATRHERVETGRRIARAAGLPVVDDYTMARLIMQREESDAAALAGAPAVLATITHPLPPSAEYHVAKAAAEEYLRSHDLEASMPVVIPAQAQTMGYRP